MWGSFGEFILELYKLDPEAAQWLGREALRVQKGKGSLYIRQDLIKSFRVGNHLQTMFNWSSTPQKHEYWKNLNRRMMEEEDNGL